LIHPCEDSYTMSDAPTVPGLREQAKTLAGYVQAVLAVGRGDLYE
jgi:hypothetical protein